MLVIILFLTLDYSGTEYYYYPCTRMGCYSRIVPVRKLFRILLVFILAVICLYVGLMFGVLRLHIKETEVRKLLHTGEKFPAEREEDIHNINVNRTLTNDVVAPNDGGIVQNISFVYFTVPKCGSRTLFYLVSSLKDQNRWGEVSSLTKLVQDKRRARTSMVQHYVTNATRPAFLYVDTSFVPLHDIPNVIYISLIRDPLERFLSAYYFEKSGDGIHGPGTGLTGKYGRDYFSHCQKSHRNDTCFGHWLGKTIHPRFCGVSKLCSQMARKTLERAKKIASVDFSVIGILEEFEDFLKLLKKKFPSHFAGIVELYRQSDTQEFVAKVKTKDKERPTADIIEKMKIDMKLDYEFYYFVKEQFHKQLKDFNVSVSDIN